MYTTPPANPQPASHHSPQYLHPWSHCPHLLQLPCGIEIRQTLLYPRGHCLFPLPHPHSRIKILFIWLVRTVGIPNLLHQILLVLEHVVPDSRKVRILQIGIQIHLHNAMADGVRELFFLRPGAAVEDKEDGLVRFGLCFFLNVGLVFAQEFRVELDVSGFVDAVNVTETGSDREVGRDGGQGFVDLVDVFWLGVEGIVIDGFVVHAVFFTTGDADFLGSVSEMLK